MENTKHPEKLNWTPSGLIQRLFLAIMLDIDHTFARFGLTYLPGQREAIQQIVTAILNFAEGKVVAIPLIPGGGKSTILRSILRVFSRFIAEGVEGILDYIGGIIVVVQTIAEMHALETICREEAGNYPICAVLESRDFSLRNGGCIAGIATCKEECLWEDCDRFADCRFMKPAPDIKKPPILFITHARYPSLVENPVKFQTWIDPDGNARLRKMVVCDESPALTDIAPLDSASMYDASRTVSDINNFRFPDYVSSLWRKNVLNKFFKLLDVIHENRNSKDAFGNITLAMMEEAGFCAEQIISVRDKLQANCKSPAAFQKVDKVLNALSAERPKKYYTKNGKTTLFCPKLRELHGEGKPATFILDGTTHYNPELKDNRNIDVQNYAFTVNTSRLTIHVQHSSRV